MEGCRPTLSRRERRTERHVTRAARAKHIKFDLYAGIAIIAGNTRKKIDACNYQSENGLALLLFAQGLHLSEKLDFCKKCSIL
jgi:hypothetical protein